MSLSVIRKSVFSAVVYAGICVSAQAMSAADDGWSDTLDHTSIDEVSRLENIFAIPEPGIILLGGLGMLTILRRRRS